MYKMDTPILFPSRLQDQNFGMCISPQDIIVPSNDTLYPNYFRPWKWYMQNVSKDCGSTIENDLKKFQITLDVQHFQPNEINVKVVNKEIMIEGKHEERLDKHGIVSRQFMRRYPLPSDCEPDEVNSSLSSDGVLMVFVKKSTKNDINEITIPIKLCDSFSKKELKSNNESTETMKNVSDTKKEEKCPVTGGIKGDDVKSQLVLKDSHSCLLKPEFIKETAGVKNFDSKSESEEELLKISEKVGLAMSMTTASDETLKAMGKKGLSTIAVTDEALKMATDIVSKISTSDESYLKLTDINAKSNSDTTDDTFKIASDLLGKTSMASETSSYSSSSMSSETITSQETSSSFISSSLKASSQKSSEICDNISAALREAAENL